MRSTDTDEVRGLFSLPVELILEILACLAFRDLLAMRQCCRLLRDFTNARVLWTTRASRLVPPMPSYRNASSSMANEEIEAYERKHAIISDRWKRAQPESSFIRHINVPEAVQRLCIVPGGRYLVTMSQRMRAYLIDLNASNQADDSVFFELKHPDGQYYDARHWRVGRDKATIYFFAEIARHTAPNSFVFWIGDFSGVPPGVNYLGQITVPWPIDFHRTDLEFFVCVIKDTTCIVLFEWKALLAGQDKFRAGVIRYQSEISIQGAHSFCVGKDDAILLFDSSTRRLLSFNAPDFQWIGSLHDLRWPEDCTYPQWEYRYSGHDCGLDVTLLTRSNDRQHDQGLFALSQSTNCLSILHADKATGFVVSHSKTDAPWSSFVLGRYRCLTRSRVHEIPGAWEFTCYTMDDKQFNWGGNSTPSVLVECGRFTVRLGSRTLEEDNDNAIWIPDSRETSGIRSYFDEESGTLCLLMSDAAGRAWRRVVVIGFS